MPSEHVQVQMRHRVEGIVTDVEDEAVARVRDSLLAGDLLCGSNHLCEQGTVFRTDRRRRLDVRARHHEHVHRCRGLNVAERVRSVAGRHGIRWDVAGNDLAEEAVAHGSGGYRSGGTLGSTNVRNRWDDDGDLDAWAAGVRAEEAATARTRQRWLRQQASEHADFASLLVELHERGTPVTVTTTAGRRHQRARITAVGCDFLALATVRGRVLVASKSIVAVQPHDRLGVTLAVDKRPTADDSMADLVRRAADTREVVALQVEGIPEPFVGELQTCGKDVVAMRIERSRSVAYLTLASVSEMSFDSG
jgi:hypothetical protein